MLLQACCSQCCLPLAWGLPLGGRQSCRLIAAFVFLKVPREQIGVCLPQEREYIEREARTQFRHNAAVRDPAQVDAMVGHPPLGLHIYCADIPHPCKKCSMRINRSCMLILSTRRSRILAMGLLFLRRGSGEVMVWGC